MVCLASRWVDKKQHYLSSNSMDGTRDIAKMATEHSDKRKTWTKGKPSSASASAATNKEINPTSIKRQTANGIIKRTQKRNGTVSKEQPTTNKRTDYTTGLEGTHIRHDKDVKQKRCMNNNPHWPCRSWNSQSIKSINQSITQINHANQPINQIIQSTTT